MRLADRRHLDFAQSHCRLSSKYKRSRAVTSALAIAAMLAVSQSASGVTNIYWQGDFSNLWDDINLQAGSNFLDTNWTTDPAADIFNVLPDANSLINFSANVAGNFNTQANGSFFVHGINANVGQPYISIATSSGLYIGAGGINKYGDQYFDFTGGPVTSTTTALTVKQDHPGGITRFFSAINNNGGNIVGLTKTGGGEVQLLNDNQYTGLTNVQNGTLTAWGPVNNNSTIKGNISVASGATLKTMDHELIADTSDITINGTWNMSGSGSPKQETFRSLSGASTGSINGGGIVLKPNGGTATYAGTLSNLYFNIGDTSVGTQILTGDSSVGVSADFNAGTLQIGNGGTTGSFAGFIRVRSGASLIFNRDGTLTHANQIDGAGTVTKTGPGTVILSAINTYTGGTTIAQGTLRTSAGTVGASGSALVVNSGATFALGGSNNNVLTGSGAINVGPFGTTTITGDMSGFTGTFTHNSTTVSTAFNAPNATSENAAYVLASSQGSSQGMIAGLNGDYTLKLGSLTGVANSLFRGGNTVSGTTTLEIGNLNTDTIFAGTVANGGLVGNPKMLAITKVGTGTLALTGANTYTGTTTISAGTLQIGNGGTTGAISTSSQIVNDANLVFNRSNSITQGTDFSSITGTGSVTKLGAGTLFLNAANSYTGGTTIAGGTLNSAHADAIGTTGDITFTGGTLQHTPANQVDYSPRIVNSTGPISIDTNGQNVTFATGLAASNTGGLTKLGTGTLTLSVANYVSGPTIISGGVLNLTEYGAVGPLPVSFDADRIQISNNATLRWDGPGNASFGALTGFSLNGTGGTVEVANPVQFLAIGGVIKGTGSLTKTGPGTLTLTANSSLGAATVVNEGMLILNGSVSDTNGYIALATGSVGSATVNNTWAHSVDVFAGASGNGHLTIESTGHVSNNGNGFVAYNPGSTGTVTVNGGTWTSDHYIMVGASGTGTLIINSGGNVSNLTDGYIAYQVGSNGTVNITGGTWSNSVDIFTGYSGTGNLTIGPGATVSNGGNGFIGYGSSGSGTVTVNSGTWTSAHDIGVGASGSGTLNINSGGNVSNLGAAYIAYQGGSSGTVNITGGTWDSSNGLFVGTGGSGNLNVGAGGLVSNGGNGFIAYSTGSTGTATVTGGTWNNAFDFIVGRLGNGTLNIATGGSVTNVIGRIAEFSGSSGTVSVTGGTWSNSDTLLVGQGGSGSLSIGTAGTVSTPEVLVGADSTASGTVNLNGGGSLTTVNINKGSGGASFDFGGGTLRASANTTAFFNNFSPTINTGGANIDTNGFNATINSPLMHNPTLGATADGGLTKSGSGTLTLSGNNTYTGSTSVTDGRLVTNYAIQNGASLNITNGAVLEVPASGNSSAVTSIGALNVTGAGSYLELHDNDLVVDYGLDASNYTQIVNYLKDGLVLLGGAGTSGIGSIEVDAQTLPGTMLAVVDNGLVGGAITSLSDFVIPHPESSTLVKYTWFGDSNLDGVVDSSDYALIDTGFTAGGTLGGWVFGDYDYSGTVDSSDYALIDTGFVSQSGVLPEPAMLGLIGLAFLGLKTRVRRRC